MKNRWQVRVVLVVCIMLSGCVTSNSKYIPDYDEDYIYNVTYYGYHPMSWGDGYYNGYGYETRDWNDSQGYVAPQPVKAKKASTRKQ